MGPHYTVCTSAYQTYVKKSVGGLGHLRERNFKRAVSKIWLIFYVDTVKLLIYQ